ncbi:MAG: hypothetical protein U5N86_02420 [Planctomycetota bacterium]|nr:hypothetical protein [Planctomycetota bacterium]
MTRIDSVQDDLDVLFGRASEKETSDRAKFADLSVEVTKLKAQMKDMATAIVAVNDYVDGLARNDIQRLSASINAVIGKYEALQNATARLADKHYSLVNKHNDAVEVINRNAKRIDNIYNSIRQLSDYAEENRRLLSNHAKVINSLSADIRSLERRVRSLELNP